MAVATALCLICKIYIIYALVVSTWAQQQPQKHRFIVGSALNTSTGSKWISPSGEFAFGFYNIKPTKLYLLGIWFDNISDKTLVWTANRDDPVEETSTVRISATGLQLSNSQTTVRQIPEQLLQNVAAAEMRDNGNFVLLNVSEQVIWQSFDTPTDTLLPGQTIKSVYNLSSRGTNTNYSTGRFVLALKENGDLMLIAAERIEDSANQYWIRQKVNALNFDTKGVLTFVDTSSNVTPIWNGTGDVGQFRSRVTLDADGILRGYIWRRNGGSSWTNLWRALDDPCNVRSQCGLNSICRMSENLPSCSCPPGFNFIDNDDHFKGCIRDPAQEDCNSNSTMVSIGQINWSGNDYGATAISQNTCINACIEDCFCVVIVYSPSGVCWRKAMPVRDGRTEQTAATFVKVLSGPPKRRKEGKGRMLVAIGAGLMAFSSSLAGIWLIIWLRGLQLRSKEQHKFAEGLQAFSYKELDAATGGFKHELGRGAFGKVYKGMLSDGKAVAVKKLKKAQQEGEKEFRTEVSIIGASHHKNLVRLYGFCDENCHRLLVYEFMSNGSLDRALFASESYLHWELRVQIALGTARGFRYLHEECTAKILHCDIKPQNILLDDNYTAKISDFGLAKLIGEEKTRTYTAARGTIGYIAPEWQRNMAITTKVDVYSFGVMLLELVCRRRMFLLDAPENEILLADWIYDCLRAGTLVKLVEQGQADCDSEIDSKQLERFVLVGLWCVQDDPDIRPSMKKVVQMLEGTVEIAVPPRASSYMGNNRST